MRITKGTRTSVRILVSSLAFVGVGLLAWQSVAQSSVAEIVKTRQEDMKKMGSSFKYVVPIVKGESDDLSVAVAPLTAVSEIAKQIPSLFPPGSGHDAVAESRAKPEVWTKRAEFEAAATQLADESGKLLAAAKANDLAGFKAQFKAYASACGGCHEGPSKDGGKFRYAKE